MRLLTRLEGRQLQLQVAWYYYLLTKLDTCIPEMR